MTYKEVIFNEIRNGIYYNYLEDLYLALVNTVEENQ